jgi:hypothetical protein
VILPVRWCSEKRHSAILVVRIGCEWNMNDQPSGSAPASANLCARKECKQVAKLRSKYCAGHAGGSLCQYVGCVKAARPSFKVCAEHGGGKRCDFAECRRLAQGSTNHCVAHGGGGRCSYPGCIRGSRGASRLCRKHARRAESRPAPFVDQQTSQLLLFTGHPRPHIPTQQLENIREHSMRRRQLSSVEPACLPPVSELLGSSSPLSNLEHTQQQRQNSSRPILRNLF